MHILAIETSGPLGSVALFDGPTLLAEQTLELGRKHAQSLIPTIREVLVVRGTAPADIGLVAVSIGPGSYTGLRVGVVTAKTFAYVVKCPLVAIDTLQAIAGNSPSETSRIDVIADAQRGDLFAGRYERSNSGQWIPRGEIRVLRAEDWAAELTNRHTVTGPGLEKFGGLAAGKCRALPAECWVPHAAQVARLGAASLAAGETADTWSVEPRYFRRSSAEVQWKSCIRINDGKRKG